MSKQPAKQKNSVKIEKPCRGFFDPHACKDALGRDHCFNCTRHLDPVTLECPKGCGKSDEHDEKVSDADQDAE